MFVLDSKIQVLDVVHSWFNALILLLEGMSYIGLLAHCIFYTRYLATCCLSVTPVVV